MTLSHLRPVELVAATLVAVVVLLVAIAPTLAGTPPRHVAAAAPAIAGGPGIECVLSPEWRLA
jgi:hypothetical protein